MTVCSCLEKIGLTKRHKFVDCFGLTLTNKNLCDNELKLNKNQFLV